MNSKNIIFLIVLVLCALTNMTQQKGKAKYSKETLSLDIDFENINLIEVKGEGKPGSKNTMKMQITRNNKNL